MRALAIPLSFIVVPLVFVAFGWRIGFDRAELNCRTEAVERGFAEWVPDKEGNTTFRWKEVAE